MLCSNVLQTHSDLVEVRVLAPTHTRVMRKIRLNKVRELRVDIQRIRDLRDARNLLVFLLVLALPEALLLGLARGGAGVDGRSGAVSPRLGG